MLVVCNGSPKSGSTWLVQIISSCEMFKRVPAEFQNEGWTTPSISEEHGQRLNEYDFYYTKHFYAKQHWEKPWAREAAQNSNILFLNIVRDLRDMMISRYFHDLRMESFKGSIEDYFKTGVAHRKLAKYIDYHRFWHGNEKESLCHLSSYEALSSDFQGSAKNVFKAIGLSSDAEIESQVSHAYEVTRFDRKKKTGEGQFFRKGQVGDFENHLEPWMIDEIYKVAEESDYRTVKENMHREFPFISPYLAKTDIGI